MLWQKNVRVEDWVTRFTVGDDYRWDTLLLPYDIEGTRAHAWGLSAIGIISGEEFQTIEAAMDRLAELAADGAVFVRPEDEDCHTVIEGYLTEQLGELGKRIHTGRSRNDQVLVTIRLFVRDHLLRVSLSTQTLAAALCDLAERYPAAIMPGYTHLQRAMPSTVASWALGYAELLAADLDTLRSAYDGNNVSPLGTAAGYGVPYLELPRQEVALRLGFRDVQLHVASAQLSRGKRELDVVHALVQVAATINRMSSDLVMYNTSEFGFVQLPAEFCTGSSIMPQKQNPDVLELSRAGYHRLASEMSLLLHLPANLPSGYHRDLQLTKEAVMRSLYLAEDLLEAMNRLVPGIHFNVDHLAEATSSELFATAVALEYVRQGVPFRDAYRKAAGELASMPRPEPDEALAAYRVDGFPGREQPGVLRARLAGHDTWLGLIILSAE